MFGRSAALAGLTQPQLIETILYEGLRRHGLLEAASGVEGAGIQDRAGLAERAPATEARAR